MMKTARRARILTATLLAIAAAGPNAWSQAAAKAGGGVVATVGSLKITNAEFTKRVGNSLFSIRNDEFELKRQILDEMIADALLNQEAAQRKISRQQLEKAEIEGKVTPVSEAEKKTTYESVKGRVQGRPEAEVLKEIERDLTQQRLAARRGQFINELRSKAGVKTFLEPPRLAVAVGSSPVLGPANAPVTIIEFSDFQCPYCSRAAATIKQLQQAHSKDVRIAYRHFPLAFHQNAAKAAEAAECAREQGKFWEMHDKLFETQGNLAVTELKKHAGELGLNAQTFGTCLDSGRLSPRWKADQDEGQRNGIKATPSFFINGRLVAGALPYERFAQIVDEELASKQPAKIKPAAAKPAPPNPAAAPTQ